MNKTGNCSREQLQLRYNSILRSIIYIHQGKSRHFTIINQGLKDDGTGPISYHTILNWMTVSHQINLTLDMRTDGPRRPKMEGSLRL